MNCGTCGCDFLDHTNDKCVGKRNCECTERRCYRQLELCEVVGARGAIHTKLRVTSQSHRGGQFLPGKYTAMCCPPGHLELRSDDGPVFGANMLFVRGCNMARDENDITVPLTMLLPIVRLVLSYGKQYGFSSVQLRPPEYPNGYVYGSAGSLPEAVYDAPPVQDTPAPKLTLKDQHAILEKVRDVNWAQLWAKIQPAVDSLWLDPKIEADKTPETDWREYDPPNWKDFVGEYHKYREALEKKAQPPIVIDSLGPMYVPQAPDREVITASTRRTPDRAETLQSFSLTLDEFQRHATWAKSCKGCENHRHTERVDRCAMIIKALVGASLDIIKKRHHMLLNAEVIAAHTRTIERDIHRATEALRLRAGHHGSCPECINHPGPCPHYRRALEWKAKASSLFSQLLELEDRKVR